MSVTHIAGPAIRIGQRVIQRCSVCGEKLNDNLKFLQGRVASFGTKEAGLNTAPEMPVWPVGEPIKFDSNYQGVLPFNDGDQLPDDCCIHLVEEL